MGNDCHHKHAEEWTVAAELRSAEQEGYDRFAMVAPTAATRTPDKEIANLELLKPLSDSNLRIRR